MQNFCLMKEFYRNLKKNRRFSHHRNCSCVLHPQREFRMREKRMHSRAHISPRNIKVMGSFANTYLNESVRTKKVERLLARLREEKRGFLSKREYTRDGICARNVTAARVRLSERFTLDYRRKKYESQHARSMTIYSRE